MSSEIIFCTFFHTTKALIIIIIFKLSLNKHVNCLEWVKRAHNQVLSEIGFCSRHATTSYGRKANVICNANIFINSFWTFFNSLSFSIFLIPSTLFYFFCFSPSAYFVFFVYSSYCYSFYSLFSVNMDRFLPLCSSFTFFFLSPTPSASSLIFSPFSSSIFAF